MPILDRAKFYAELRLDPAQREAAEDAVRAIIASKYRKAVGR